MAPVRPTVYTPVAPLAIGSGVTMLLISVELWPDEIVIHLARELDPATGQVEIAEEFSEPGERSHRESRPDITRRASRHFPMNRTFGIGTASVDVHDDVDTQYRVTAGHTRGTRNEWRGGWHFTPGVPDTATALTFALNGEGISSATPVALELR